MEWHIIGDGSPDPTCGRPWAYHEWSTWDVAWGPQQCTRRTCPRCADHRYLHDAAQDLTGVVMAWVLDRIASGGLFDAQGRSLKIYKYRYSRCPNDSHLIQARMATKRDCAAHGLIAGYTIIHPWRGAHAQDASPAECRAAMDRSHLSIHTHGIAIGYWSEPSVPGQDHYYHATLLADVRDWIDEDEQIRTAERVNKYAQYSIGHAGWYGDRGQCISTWGQRPDRSACARYIPPAPGLLMQHPGITMDGEPVWEARTPPSEDAIHEIRRAMSDAWTQDPEACDAGGWDQHMLRSGGRIDRGLYSIWALDEVAVMPDHSTWWRWRASVANTIAVLSIEAREKRRR